MKLLTIILAIGIIIILAIAYYHDPSWLLSALGLLVTLTLAFLLVTFYFPHDYEDEESDDDELTGGGL